MQFLLWLRVSKLNQAGTAPVYLRIFLDNATRVEYATGIRCRPERWQGGERKIKGQDAATRNDNATLDTLKSRARLAASDLQTAATGRPVLPADVARVLRPQQAPAAPLLTELLLAAIPRHSPRATTQTTYAFAVQWLAKWPGAKRLRLDGLTAEVATEFTLWLAQQSPGAVSKRSYLTHLAGLLATAAPAHPPVFRKLTRLLGQPPETPQQVLPAGWQQQLLALSLPSVQALARDAFLLAYYLHGCRIGKVLELQWQHVDAGQGRVRFTTHKRPVNKDIALSPQLLELLARYRGQCAVFVLPLLPATYPQADELTQLRLRKRAAVRVEKSLAAISRKLGWPKLNPHLARHTLALTSYHKNGNDLRVPQQLLGHKSISTTAKYIASLDATQLDDAAANAYD